MRLQRAYFDRTVSSSNMILLPTAKISFTERSQLFSRSTSPQIFDELKKVLIQIFDLPVSRAQTQPSMHVFTS